MHVEQYLMMFSVCSTQRNSWYIVAAFKRPPPCLIWNRDYYEMWNPRLCGVRSLKTSAVSTTHRVYKKYKKWYSIIFMNTSPASQDRYSTGTSTSYTSFYLILYYIPDIMFFTCIVKKPYCARRHQLSSSQFTA